MNIVTQGGIILVKNIEGFEGDISDLHITFKVFPDILVYCVFEKFRSC